MKKLNAFSTTKKFYAVEHFPYGISRSGEFNQKQAKLLEEHGEAYLALSSGARLPVNGEEEDFVLVCNGEKAPETDHERTWLRYCEKIQAPVVTAAFSGKPTPIKVDSYSSDEEW